MTEDRAGDVTVLLKAVKEGLPGAPDRLMSLVYDELKHIAWNRAASAGTGSMEPTTLVHEAYLRMFAKADPAWENRHHFFWAAARAMRDILVERARRQGAEKRGGQRRRIELDDDLPQVTEAEDLLALTGAIRRLEAFHPDSAHLVILRFFAGLTREQVAEVTGMSASAVWRDWSFAKAWLLAELQGPEATKNKSDA
jgi:RNA polymerase sigma factor (TIGR02999 family)